MTHEEVAEVATKNGIVTDAEVVHAYRESHLPLPADRDRMLVLLLDRCKHGEPVSTSATALYRRVMEAARVHLFGRRAQAALGKAAGSSAASTTAAPPKSAAPSRTTTTAKAKATAEKGTTAAAVPAKDSERYPTGVRTLFDDPSGNTVCVVPISLLRVDESAIDDAMVDDIRESQDLVGRLHDPIVWYDGTAFDVITGRHRVLAERQRGDHSCTVRVTHEQDPARRDLMSLEENIARRTDKARRDHELRRRDEILKLLGLRRRGRPAQPPASEKNGNVTQGNGAATDTGTKAMSGAERTANSRARKRDDAHPDVVQAYKDQKIGPAAVDRLRKLPLGEQVAKLASEIERFSNSRKRPRSKPRTESEKSAAGASDAAATPATASTRVPEATVQALVGAAKALDEFCKFLETTSVKIGPDDLLLTLTSRISELTDQVQTKLTNTHDRLVRWWEGNYQPVDEEAA